LASVLLDLSRSEGLGELTWELVVVDNGSVDHTENVVKDAQVFFPVSLQYVVEQRPGRSFALNTGVAASGGEIIVFTDDDVEVGTGWLASIVRPFAEPKVSGVAGRVIPKFTAALPDWLPLGQENGVSSALLLFDLGDQQIQIFAPPVGANMAFRRNALTRLGGFLVALGAGTRAGFGEDTEFGHRFLKEGLVLIYSPEAQIHHPIGPERINKQYLRSWYLKSGRANVLSARLTKVDEYGFRDSLTDLRALAGHVRAAVTGGDHATRFLHQLLAYKQLGRVLEGVFGAA
jgi:GT2 family glycosyltransferase